MVRMEIACQSITGVDVHVRTRPPLRMPVPANEELAPDLRGEAGRIGVAIGPDAPFPFEAIVLDDAKVLDRRKENRRVGASR